VTIARTVRVRGVVQGVGFRPFVYRLARANSLAGWVWNEPYGVDIHLEGAESALRRVSRADSVAPGRSSLCHSFFGGNA